MRGERLVVSDFFDGVMYTYIYKKDLNGVEAESIISKQFSVLSALEFSLFTRYVKMCDFHSFSIPFRVVSPM